MAEWWEEASVPIGHTSNPEVFIYGVDAGADQCEVCGQHLTRLQVKQVELPDGTIDHQPTGPWYEAREHHRDGGTHHWWQEHNCIKPQPDECPFCEQAQRLGHDPTSPRP
jgi:hypothetical protein